MQVTWPNSNNLISIELCTREKAYISHMLFSQLPIVICVRRESSPQNWEWEMNFVNIISVVATTFSKQARIPVAASVIWIITLLGYEFWIEQLPCLSNGIDPRFAVGLGSRFQLVLSLIFFSVRYCETVLKQTVAKLRLVELNTLAEHSLNITFTKVQLVRDYDMNCVYRAIQYKTDHILRSLTRILMNLKYDLGV